MKMKIALFIALSFLFSACIPRPVYITITTTPAPIMPSPTAILMVPIVIAIQDIPAGTEIGPDRVTVILFPAESAPMSAYTSLEAVVGQYALSNIYREEMILASKISDNPEIADLGTTIPVVIASQNLEAGHVLEEADLAVTFFTANSIEVFESNGYDMSGLFGERSDLLGKTLSINLNRLVVPPFRGNNSKAEGKEVI
jgi:Flp pilus assembly protein CpaB